jgi:hypothetical protein
MENQLHELSLDPFITKNFEHRWVVNRLKNFYKNLPPKLNENEKKLMLYLHLIDLFD